MSAYDALLPPEPPTPTRSCHDCGRTGKLAFTSVITHTGDSRVYCSDCKMRRGVAYVFDERRWVDIQREDGVRCMCGEDLDDPCLPACNCHRCQNYWESEGTHRLTHP